VVEYVYCREKARECLGEAQRSDLTEEERKLFLLIASQWLELAGEIDSLGVGHEPIIRT
jgi:hypothetical protein